MLGIVVGDGGTAVGRQTEVLAFVEIVFCGRRQTRSKISKSNI